MMYHPVSKICGKYFSFYGLVYYKGDGLARQVSAAVYLFVKFYQITFIIYLKSKGIDGIAFVTAASEIGFE